MQEEATEIEQEEEVVEPWMETEEPDPEDGGAEPGTIPAVAHLKIKEKLKARLADRDEELERIKKELEELKAGTRQKPMQHAQAPQRPKRADFDDEDAYYEAVDAYQDQILNQRLSMHSNQTEQERKMSEARQRIKSAEDAHWDRAARLVSETGISEDIYRSAHSNVLHAVKSSLKAADPDGVVAEFINVLGEGSEKVLYFVGNNKTALNEFRAILSDDPSGIRAAAFLGAQKERLSKPLRRSSSAPNPPREIPGGMSVTDGSLKKKYLAAKKAGDFNTALNARLDAKKKGIDVSGW